MLASCGADQTVRIWDTRRRQMVRSLGVSREPVRKLDVSADGQYLSLVGWDRVTIVRLADRLGYEVLEPPSPQPGRHSIVRWSRDGHRIAVQHSSPVGRNPSEHDVSLRIFDVRTRRMVAAHEDIHHGLSPIVWATDGASILAYDAECKRYEYSATTSNSWSVNGDLQGVNEIFQNLALNQKLGLVAIGCDTEVRIYDATSSLVENRLHHDYVHAVNISPRVESRQPTSWQSYA